MSGLAHDRGLFVPDSFPTVSMEELESWRSLSYADLAVEVISKFVQDDQVPRKKLEDIVKRSCASFRHKDVTPLVEQGGHYILVSTGSGLHMCAPVFNSYHATIEMIVCMTIDKIHESCLLFFSDTFSCFASFI